MLEEHRNLDKSLLVNPGAANGEIYFALGSAGEGAKEQRSREAEVGEYSERACSYGRSQVGNEVSLANNKKGLAPMGDSRLPAKCQCSIFKEKEKTRKELDLPEDVFLIITSRRLASRTGVDVLIRAFGEAKKVLEERSEEHTSELQSH